MNIVLKKGFALFSTLIIVTLFAYLSIFIIQNQAFSSQIDKLKYLEIQGKIHLLNIEKFINLSHDIDEIKNYKVDDNRFIYTLTIEDINETNRTNFHINIKSKTNLVTLYKKIEK